MNENQPPGASVSGPDAILLAWITAAITNAITITRSFRLPPRLLTRVLHHAFDTGHFLALGLAGAGLVGLYVRFGHTRRRTSAAVFVVLSLALGALVLPSDLATAAERHASGHAAWVETALLILAVGLLALTVPLAVLLGRLAARPYLRWVALAAAAALLSANPVLLQGDYAGARLFVAFAAAALFAAALAGAALPARLAPFVARLRPLRAPFLAIASLAAAASLVIAPRPTVALALQSPTGSLLPPFLGPLHEDAIVDDAPVPPEMAPWFADRKDAPPVPPSAPSVLPASPVVFLFSIDCLRNDLLASGKYDEKLPTLASLRRQGVYFRNGRSPGAQTVYSLSALFAGTYFSQQYWTPSTGDVHGLWPENDPTPRFPELLRARGVTTVTFAGAPWLVNRYGIVRGFSEETFVRPVGNHFTLGKHLVDAALRRLAATRGEPLFLYIHFLDAHAPYDLAGGSGPELDRYLGELALVDAEIGRVVRMIAASPLADRAAFVITSDHGEAFGEHGQYRHANSLYDELLRVPLLVQAKGLTPRVVDEPVTLVDLGPTMLDLFGVETPGTFLGQSLVPFLRGESPTLTRPILAETRMKRALVLRDGTKVTVDDRSRTLELYDLASDPGEMRSLADDPTRLLPPLSLLRRFLATHTLRREGYVTPYRR
ncbi:sulfatase [Polyangium mundeleinium]|uniref:Sulfatase n=1 Tax=Polyangium mundeleinium TaxID=2995306 RepID=A0ABT5EI18_9BACT|nr:sulfatase [Polyangium mundeleinium]MDC0741022.1 sulfatase [Polyangium mundeleinium]